MDNKRVCYIPVTRYTMKAFMDIAKEYDFTKANFSRECIKYCINRAEVIEYLVAKKKQDKKDRIARLKAQYKKL